MPRPAQTVDLTRRKPRQVRALDTLEVILEATARILQKEGPAALNTNYIAARAGISVGTLSKPLGLPGLRLGWLAAPEEIVRRCWALRDYVSLSPAKLSDALALLALTHRERLLDRTRAIATENYSTLHDFMEDHADVLSWAPPRGGLLALPRYAFDIPSYEFANRLAEERGVMLAPGAAFGQERHLRIGFGPQPALFREGLAVVGDYLRDVGG